MPGRPGEKAAVMAAKDFVLAVLYADYTGDRDQRWRSYAASPRVRTGLAAYPPRGQRDHRVVHRDRPLLADVARSGPRAP